jgi:hypothetical protein
MAAAAAGPAEQTQQPLDLDDAALALAPDQKELPNVLE